MLRGEQYFYLEMDRFFAENLFMWNCCNNSFKWSFWKGMWALSTKKFLLFVFNLQKGLSLKTWSPYNSKIICYTKNFMGLHSLNVNPNSLSFLIHISKGMSKETKFPKNQRQITVLRVFKLIVNPNTNMILIIFEIYFTNSFI